MAVSPGAGRLGALELSIDAEPIPLDQGDLRTLGAWRPEHGVLTLYVHADPTAQAHSTPPWRIEIDNALAEIDERLDETGALERRQAFQRLRREAGETIEAVCDPSAPGRGRALMLPLGGDGPTRALALQVPLPTGAHLDSGPRLLPLLAALDRSSLIGVVAAAKGEVQVLETRLGAVREVETRAFSPGDADPGQHRGPAAANPARGQQSVSHADKHEQHERERRSGFFGSVLSDVQSRRSAAGWDGVLVAADPGLAEELAEAMAGGGDEVRLVHRDIEGRASHELIEDLGPELEDLAAERLARALAEAMDAAAASGHGVQGLGATLDALNNGRVEHLFLPEDGDLPGTRLDDGRLSAETGAGEPLDSLFEAMAAHAFETSARVSVVGSGGPEAVVAATRW